MVKLGTISMVGLLLLAGCGSAGQAAPTTTTITIDRATVDRVLDIITDAANQLTAAQQVTITDAIPFFGAAGQHARSGERLVSRGLQGVPATATQVADAEFNHMLKSIDAALVCSARALANPGVTCAQIGVSLNLDAVTVGVVIRDLVPYGTRHQAEVFALLD